MTPSKSKMKKLAKDEARSELKKGKTKSVKDKPLNFVLIGRSGCGKGTQVKLLVKHFGNLVVISTGDLFRDLAKANTDASKRIKIIVKSGDLPYDDLATTLWMREISYRVKEGEGILADGFPRRLNEAKAFDRFLHFLNREENTFYILIDVSREEAFNRLTRRRICIKCGKLIPWLGKYKSLKVCDSCSGKLEVRPDDTLPAIENRLNYYDEKVSKVIKYYEKKGKLIRINGEQSIERVFKDILKTIKNKKR